MKKLVIVTLVVVLLFTAILKFYRATSQKREYFNNYQRSQAYSHTVDLPINTTFSCENMCGPTAVCSITGEQCTSDIDCHGCLPQEGPPQYFQGVNQWRELFDAKNQMYQNKYNASLSSEPFYMKYPARLSLSGEFVEEGPEASGGFK